MTIMKSGRWSDKENTRLVELRQSGLTFKEIAKKMKRPEGSCYAKFKKLEAQGLATEAEGATTDVPPVVEDRVKIEEDLERENQYKTQQDELSKTIYRGGLFVIAFVLGSVLAGGIYYLAS